MHEFTISKLLRGAARQDDFVAVHGVKQMDTDLYCCVMTYCKCKSAIQSLLCSHRLYRLVGSLDSYLFGDWRSNLSPDERDARIRQCSLRLIGAVGFMHSIDIVHCDLALRNVLSADADLCNVKLADFELARCMDANYVEPWSPWGSKTAPCKVALLHTPPEVASHVDDAMYTKKSDVWQLGVLLWELMSAHAFEDSSRQHQAAGDWMRSRCQLPIQNEPVTKELMRSTYDRLKQSDEPHLFLPIAKINRSGANFQIEAKDLFEKFWKF